MNINRIRDLREDHDLTQAELARMLSVSRQAYSGYERGVRSIPFEILCQFALFYGTSLDYLTGRTDVKAPYPKPKQKNFVVRKD
ncbi:DNA-binding helix-turn-helix protein [[Clostridium] methylpentosum DSM 5476]|uniref:DNA-binding helix-turn-helix protein n=1 Tax=[Clostridium] methylpentosum DSM 5476 TaxID=537013 RepID=C0EC85_9FIRM|nr:DNA-binding helix-turn-helix protein [[Clostridium] methylpentosum DSM 5476]MDY3989565.1 helix-turn-helix transcriptional regulator [Massilioclostridium sp.]MEE1492784.1 helix-turn-helix transcriptional regulator [Massilioclostridium sp.]